MTTSDVPRFLAPSRAPVRPVVVALAMMVFVLVAGLALAHSSGITRAELSVDQWFSEHHSAFLTGVADAFVVMFEPTVGAAILAFVALVVFLVSRRILVAVAYLFVTLGTLAAAEILKLLVRRDRPSLTALADPPPVDHAFSYPSGHTTVATVLVVSLVLLLPGVWKWVAGIAGGILVVLVAVSRFYLGSHYPTDVLASILFGVAGVVFLRVMIANLILPLIQRRRGMR